MKPYIFIAISLFLFNFCDAVTFSEALKNLKVLESYITQYKSEKKSSASLTHLIVSFIREGKYSDTTWSIAGGSFPKDLVSYVNAKDAEKSTTAMSCRTYGNIVLPTKEKIDFVHMFAVMNGIENSKSYSKGFSALVGWGGDSAQLVQDLKKYNGTLDELIAQASKLLGVKGQFGEGDLNSDLDAPVILNNKTDKNTFAEIIERYYNGDEWKSRVPKFVKLTFPNLKEKSELRTTLFNRYKSDNYIQILECKYGIRKGGSLLGCYSPKGVIAKYVNHQKAAVYALADYLKNKL